MRALYGLKSASASFRAHMAKKLDEMGFKSSVADPDVWLRPASRADGEQYYEYILMYVDNILAISADPMPIMEDIQRMVKFKNDKIAVPPNYLGAKLLRKNINGIDCWSITSLDYVKATVETVEEGIEGKKWKLYSKAKTPMTRSFVPELDGTPKLDANETQYFQELIGMLRWATELGRVDILHEVLILSQYQASPREGHMEQIMHIFSFLKNKPKLSIYMDPSLPIIEYGDFRTKKEAFAEYYRGAEEPMPHDMPRPRGRPVVTTEFVCASHAANKKTRRSHTGFLLFLNRSPILWYSKRQQTVESSTFSSEFIALRTGTQASQYLRFKLRMFGIPIVEGHTTNIFCDNESVVKNSTNVESVLNKKHSSVAYHYVRWTVAAGIITVAWIRSEENLADPFTKRLAEITREYLFGNWTY
jgi:hypothetical protein